MCHLLLTLPLVALPVFWLFPWPVASAFYSLALIVALVTYFYAFAAAHRPPEIGPERLPRATGTVISVEPELRVRVDHELWLARSREPLAPGDAIVVESREGLKLRVRRSVRIPA